jgi:hypothetical protein
MDLSNGPFLNFRIITDDSDHSLGTESTPMLINTAHIVSIKPIRIIKQNDIVDGYWIRTSNNKKYRAIEIPPQLKKMLAKEITNSKLIETIDARTDEYLSDIQ